MAEYIDPDYAKLLKEAIAVGVEVYCYACEFEISQGIPTALSRTRAVPLI